MIATLPNSLCTLIDQHAALLVRDGIENDRAAAFPQASISALHQCGLMNAAAPRDIGGLGLTPHQLAAVAERLGRLAGSTAMIWAMHQIQVGCLAAATNASHLLQRTVTDRLLIASVTSEVGTGGMLRTSRAAVQSDDEHVRLVKQAPTISYAEYADAFLITARRHPDAAAQDQVLVWADAADVELSLSKGWDPLGMRSTCSPGGTVTVHTTVTNVLTPRFGVLADQVMLPLSHLLWSAVWSGIAADAAQRANTSHRTRIDKSGDDADPRVAWMHAELLAINASISALATAMDDDSDRLTGQRANALKLTVAERALHVAETALCLAGMPGFSESGPWAIARHLRDLHSAQLMVSNDRIAAMNASLVLYTG